MAVLRQEWRLQSIAGAFTAGIILATDWLVGVLGGLSFWYLAISEEHEAPALNGVVWIVFQPLLVLVTSTAICRITRNRYPHFCSALFVAAAIITFAMGVVMIYSGAVQNYFGPFLSKSLFGG